MGWDACVTGGVKVHVVPGGHVDMMIMPSVRAVADNLAAFLDIGSNQKEEPVIGSSGISV
jgi:thioesterase domain-containing protein